MTVITHPIPSLTGQGSDFVNTTGLVTDPAIFCPTVNVLKDVVIGLFLVLVEPKVQGMLLVLGLYW